LQTSRRPQTQQLQQRADGTLDTAEFTPPKDADISFSRTAVFALQDICVNLRNR
jgi:hypothetical protein